MVADAEMAGVCRFVPRDKVTRVVWPKRILSVNEVGYLHRVHLSVPGPERFEGAIITAVA
jgi:hypothetical protein